MLYNHANVITHYLGTVKFECKGCFITSKRIQFWSVTGCNKNIKPIIIQIRQKTVEKLWWIGNELRQMT